MREGGEEAIKTREKQEIIAARASGHAGRGRRSYKNEGKARDYSRQGQNWLGGRVAGTKESPGRMSCGSERVAGDNEMPRLMSCCGSKKRKKG